MEKFYLSIKSTGSYKVLDFKGHGHKAAVYKSHFPPPKHLVVIQTPVNIYAPMTQSNFVLNISLI